jgi:hypothetical protein
MFLLAYSCVQHTLCFVFFVCNLLLMIQFDILWEGEGGYDENLK